jgi:hypothetical protein
MTHGAVMAALIVEDDESMSTTITSNGKRVSPTRVSGRAPSMCGGVSLFMLAAASVL